LLKGLLFEGEGRRDGAEAFADAGGSAVYGGEKVLEGVDGPPEAAAGFFRGVVRSTICDVEVDT
jgi:hypothetical protein